MTKQRAAIAPPNPHRTRSRDDTDSINFAGRGFAVCDLGHYLASSILEPLQEAGEARHSDALSAAQPAQAQDKEE